MWLRRNIGVVSQEPVLFDMTIGENISFGKEGVTQTDIESASKQANIHGFISQLPQVRNLCINIYYEHINIHLALVNTLFY